MARGGIDQCPNCFRGRHGQCDDPSCVCCGSDDYDDETQSANVWGLTPSSSATEAADLPDSRYVRRAAARSSAE